jgi:hypothetical protein
MKQHFFIIRGFISKEKEWRETRGSEKKEKSGLQQVRLLLYRSVFHCLSAVSVLDTGP